MSGEFSGASGAEFSVSNDALAERSRTLDAAFDALASDQLIHETPEKKHAWFEKISAFGEKIFSPVDGADTIEDALAYATRFGEIQQSDYDTRTAQTILFRGYAEAQAAVSDPLLDKLQALDKSEAGILRSARAQRTAQSLDKLFDLRQRAAVAQTGQKP